MSPEPAGQAKMDNEAASETVRPQSFPELPNILKNASTLAHNAYQWEENRQPPHPGQMRRLAILRDSLDQTASLVAEGANVREAEIYSQLKKLQARLEEREAGMESAFEPLLKFIREGETE